MEHVLSLPSLLGLQCTIKLALPALCFRHRCQKLAFYFDLVLRFLGLAYWDVLEPKVREAIPFGHHKDMPHTPWQSTAPGGGTLRSMQEGSFKVGVAYFEAGER